MEGDSVVSRYVERVLNGLDVAEVHSLFSPGYFDHDPLIIPGITERDGVKKDRYYLEQLVRFLSLPTVDILFELLDVCGSETEGRFAARIRGEGIIGLDGVDTVHNAYSRLAISTDERLPVPEVVVPSVILRPEGKLVGKRLHVGYSVLAMFAVSNGQITEKWGIEVLT